LGGSRQVSAEHGSDNRFEIAVTAQEQGVAYFGSAASQRETRRRIAANRAADRGSSRIRRTKVEQCGIEETACTPGRLTISDPAQLRLRVRCDWYEPVPSGHPE
jgi:hypothetical protein